MTPEQMMLIAKLAMLAQAQQQRILLLEVQMAMLQRSGAIIH